MARRPLPWFREDRQAWFVTIRGARHNLGPDKRAAFERYYELMRQPRTSAPVASTSFAAIADAFLDWVKANQSPETFEWYRYRLERYCRAYPDQIASDVRPYHVQVWVDSYGKLSKTSRRNYVRSVKRCMKWATQQGYLGTNPISSMEVPGADAKEVRVTKAAFEKLRGFIREPKFLELCEVCYETGCRPQEILRVESRHLDHTNRRWVLPPSEAKGKKRPRIVYLPPKSFAICERLATEHPSGKMFRNTRGKAWTTDAVNCMFDRIRVRMGKASLRDVQKDLEAVTRESLGLSSAEWTQRSTQKRRKLQDQVAAMQVPRYSLYAFRHSWATNALESGVDALTVATLMGHSDPSTLARVYSHISSNPEHMAKQAIKALG